MYSLKVENVREFDSYQLTSDLKRCLLFFEFLAVVVSECSFGADVCLRRPAGFHRKERL